MLKSQNLFIPRKFFCLQALCLCIDPPNLNFTLKRLSAHHSSPCPSFSLSSAHKSSQTMCLWPDRVEVQERRPRTWNEPRHQRLSFVRGRKRESDEWTPPPRRLTQVEIWDRRRMQELDQQGFRPHFPYQQLQGPDPRITQLPPQGGHFQPGHHGGQPGHHGGHPGHHGGEFDGHGDHGDRPQLGQHSHHSDDSIIGIVEGDHDGHDGHDDPRQRLPRYILVEPKIQLPKGLKAHTKKKSRGHKKKHANSSSEDSSSSDDSSGFTQGYRAGRRSLSRRPVPRGRSRSRFTDDSFEDLMDSHYRSRSRGGRRH